ncbi:MAG: hypothetical protein GY870_10295, partial [archaeon]|nr:hypothetical protein [archaeon]
LTLILMNKYSTRLLTAYMGSVGTGLIIHLIDPGMRIWTFSSQMELIVPLLVMGFMLLYHIFYYQKENNPKIYYFIWDLIKWGTIPALVIFGIIFWNFPEIIPFGMGSRFQSILNPNIRNAINLVASVGEHKPSPWSVFYFNSLIPVILTPLGIYYAVKRGREEDVLLLVFVLTLLYFTGSMIRIILLLAPALALVGAYGLSFILKFFGSLIGKKQVITRRRKRQIRKTLGSSEAVIVYVLIGIMCFAQVNHATTVSIEQMSWTELVAGGSFHDWEETLSYINENLDQDDVVVSWWDYGYWLSMIGNVTTVNDNGTNNSTRLGTTGMAMMQTDELYSAKIFKQLHADYVCVFFGHLLGGLGGDEGKWPWMLRICNDHFGEYTDFGWTEDNWASEQPGGDEEVFDEDEYINSSSGLYEDKWFETTLVKLMFYGEPTSISTTPQGYSLGGYYAQEIEGNAAEGKSPRTDDNGNTWASHIPTDGAYDLKCFIPYYFSSSQLVKIYKVDYTALESSFELENSSLSTNNIAHVDIKNTGTQDVTISQNITINGINYPSTIKGSNYTIPVDESRTLWVDTNDPAVSGVRDWQYDDVYNMTVYASTPYITDPSISYIFSEEITGLSVINAPEFSVEIDRENSQMYKNADNPSSCDVSVIVNNNGDDTVKIEGFTVNAYYADASIGDFPIDNPNILINPGESEEFYLQQVGGYAEDFSYSLKVETEENASDIVEMTVSDRNYNLSIISEERGLTSEEILKQNPDFTRRYIDITDENTFIYENGSMQITLNNTGSETLSLKSLFVGDDSDVSLTPFSVEDNDSWLSAGETVKIYTNISNVQRNEPIKIITTAEKGSKIASDTAWLIPKGNETALAIVEGSDFTQIYTNETVEITLKNVGDAELTINGFKINGTDISLSEDDIEFIYGGSNNFTLDIDEVLKFNLNITENIKINETNTVNLTFYNDQYEYSQIFNTVLPLPFAYITISGNSNYTDPNLGIHIYSQIAIFNVTIDTITINGEYLLPDDPSISGIENGIVQGGYNWLVIVNSGFTVTDAYIVIITFREGWVVTSHSIDGT